MLRMFSRRSNDVTYFTNDHANELEGLRESAGWWLRGDGDLGQERDVARVFTSTPRAQIQGYDLVFAAPRPLSILLAVDPLSAPELIKAHRESVAASVHYLEERALVLREGRRGEVLDSPGEWERIASFTHGVNRHGEPHLHDHVLVGARLEGANTVLDARSLFVHLGAADALYRSSLRQGVAQRTKWEAWRSFEGIEHVANLDEGYRALWGGHHKDRGTKRHWQRDEILRSWNDDLVRFESVGSLEVPTRHRATLDEHLFSAQLEGSREIPRRHVVQAWANAARFGQRVEDVTKSIDALYPRLETSRGVREVNLGIEEVRMTALVRERGARPLSNDRLELWTQRSRERSGPGERSR
jgi:hypothetical protein